MRHEFWGRACNFVIGVLPLAFGAATFVDLGQALRENFRLATGTSDATRLAHGSAGNQSRQQMSYVNSGSDALACSALAAMLGPCEPLRRNAMSATQKPAGSSDDSDEFRDGQVSRVPDEDGPHDVPDDKVIDKTLPAKPVPDRAGSGSP
jgi:hypothetical protein